MECDLWYVSGSLVWEQCIGEAEVRESEESELLLSELLAKKRDCYNGPRGHLFICQSFKFLNVLLMSYTCRLP